MLDKCKYLISYNDEDGCYCKAISEYGLRELRSYYNDDAYCVGDWSCKKCWGASFLDRIDYEDSNRCQHLSLEVTYGGFFSTEKIVGICARQGITIEKEEHLRSCCKGGRGSFPCGFRESQSEVPQEGCLMTMACLVRGLSDDCEELQTLRKFRDLLTGKADRFAALCKEYYQKSPIIVFKINQEKNSKEIYDDLYDNFVSKCVNALKLNDIETAVNIYTNRYKALEEKYNI